MTRQAVPVLAALLIFAACAGRAGPQTAPAEESGGISPYVAGFSARGNTSQGSLRLRGVLAVGPGGGLRVEIAGPAGAGPFFLVANSGEVTLILGSEGIFHRAPVDAPVLSRLLEVDLTPADLSGLLWGAPPAVGERCSIRRGRWKELSGGWKVPTRLRFTCEEALLDLRLQDPRPLAAADPHQPFRSPPLPSSYEAVDLESIVEAIRSLASDRL
jgi:hypothetical protein